MPRLTKWDLPPASSVLPQGSSASSWNKWAKTESKVEAKPQSVKEANLAPHPSHTATTSALIRELSPHKISSAERKPASRQQLSAKVPSPDLFKTDEVKKVKSVQKPTDVPTSSIPTDDLVDLPSRHAKSHAAFKKERGSLASHIRDIELPSHSRVRNAATYKGKDREKKFKSTKKKINVDVFIPSVISVNNFARLLNVTLARLQRVMERAGMSEQSSHDHMLTSDYSSLLAMEFGRNPVINDEAAFDIHPPPPVADKSKLPLRPPIVTIMGHVDHGKTTLLDTLRSASVAKGEAGGITQHIGAFSVPVTSAGSQRTITFLDTPGHAAFSAMRARGAGVTDIVVLVVAADDGIMPQTREVIELVKKDEGKTSLVVAINKIDKPGVDVYEVEKALLAEGVQLESLGGDVPSVHVSGLTGQGLDDLVDTINAVAEMQDLRAETDNVLQGYVLESKVQKGLGAVATVLVSRGTLKAGNHLICGTTHAKVRLITSPTGSSLKSISPGTAAVVSGWKELPQAGDEVLQGSEADVKRAVVNRIRAAELRASMNDLEAINVSRREEREKKEAEERDARSKKGAEQIADEPTTQTSEEVPEKKLLNLIIKADVSGSAEAMAGALQGIGNKLVGVKIVASSVGDVSESDIMRAKASNAMIIAFSVNTPRPMQSLAAGNSVEILSSPIIYRLMDDVKQKVIGLLPVKYERRVTGEATVQQLFDIHLKAKQIMKVAGSRVMNGVIKKDQVARVVRDGNFIFEGKLETFKHLKADITEAPKGMECGISLEKFSDLQPGDIIQTFQEVELPRSL
ncbi:hypothetical protein C8Q75DRAFT_708753 [Abortiporus biennis]|nr:hypothetical protein C8Q75DRAFT_708753 [Abortiporus biennis]